MLRAIELSHRCPPASGAYAVGAILVAADGHELSRGHSREHDPTEHAEESALAKLDIARPELATATMYSTLEPCSQRKSRPKTCAQHIIDAGIGRVVIAWREPPLFVADCQGVEQLIAAGVDVVELTELADLARAANTAVGA